jgi:hypothetical protein
VIYMTTARLMAGNPNKWAVLEKGAVQFTTRGWCEFAADMTRRAPALGALLARVDGPVTQWLTHPSYQLEGEPLSIVWTDEECRQLFQYLSTTCDVAKETAYDFWEFLALVCCGINEEGITAY